jgi:fibronectin-binding autotransporter adhesin
MITACLAAVVVGTPSASAQTSRTWSGAMSNAWATTTNWSGGVVPGATSGTTSLDIALFNTNPTNRAPTWSTYLNLAGFTFDTGAGAYTIGTTSGSAAFLTSGGTTQLSRGVTAAQIINAPLVILNASGSNSGSYTFLNSATASAATLTLGGAISGQATAGNTTAITFDSTQAGTISGVISDGTAGGAVSLTKSNAGTLTLSVANTYSGVTSLVGRFSVWGDANGNGLLTASPFFGNYGALQVSGSLSATSGVSISGGGTFINGNSTAASNNGVTNRINSTATLTIGGAGGGGTFQMAAPAASSVHSQSFASLAIGPGYNLINANAATGTTNLTFTGAAGSVYTRSTGGVVNFVPGTGVFNIGFTNAPSINVAGTGSNAILVGAFLSGTNFISATSGNLTAAAYTPNTASTLPAGANIDVTTLSTTGLTGLQSINSLRFRNTAKQTISLTSGTLQIASGGIITGTGVPSAAPGSASAITGGALTSGTNELILSLQNTNYVRQQTPSLQIDSQIVDNGAPVGLNIFGASNVTGGMLLLTNTSNSFTGNIYLNGANLMLATAANGAVTDAVLGGTNTIYATSGRNFIMANLGTGNPWTNKHNISIAPGALLDISTQNGPITVNASVTGSGVLGIGIGTYNEGNGVVIPVDQSGFTGTYQIGTFLRANDGVGLSSNANLVLSPNNISGGGVLETSANMVRSLGAGPGQVRIGQMQSNSFGGGFSAVSGTAGANPITVSLGGLGTPQTLTWGAGGFMPAANGGGANGLVLQNGNANNALTWANPINNNGYLVFVFQNASTSGTATAATMTGAISGAGGFQKTGAGLLVLSANNIYTGKTSILNGTLGVATIGSVSGTGNLGSPTTVANATIDIGAATVAATLRYTGSGEATDRVVNLAGTTGGATLDQSGSGLLRFTSALTATGAGSKTLTLQGSTAGTGEIAGSIVNNSGSNLTNVTKAGTGTWTLSGANTYTGVTTINGGVLSVATLANGGANSSIGASTNAAANLVLGGGSLQYTGGTLTTDRSFTLTASTTSTIDVSSAAATLTFTGSTTATTGALTKAGAGTLALAGAAAYTGATAINAGTLQIGNGGTAGGLSASSAISVASGATLAFSRTDAYGGTFSNTVSGSGGVTLLSGSLTLSGNNTYTGQTTVSGGVLIAGRATNAFGSSAPLAVTSGTVSLAGVNQTVGALSGSAGALITTLAAGNGTLTTTFASGTSTFAGSITNGSGGTSFTKAGAGTQVLSGVNTYTGATTVSAGTLQIGSGGTTGGLSSSSAISVASGATLAFNRSDDYGGNFTNAISGAGGVTLLSGSLTLSAANTYTGSTSINGGTLAVNGSLASAVAIDSGAFLGGSGSISGVLSGAGIVSPGNSPGILTAGQFDPTAGLGAAFEFTGFAPTYNAPSASVNDVLRLTNGSPFIANLTSANTIDVYFNVDSIAAGDIFEGGFFTGLSAGDLLTNVQNAQFNYWIKSNAGSTVFGGVNYASLSSVSGVTGVTLNTISRTTNFGSGDVTGSVTQFVIVPEPGALALAGIGIAVAGWLVRRRK